MDITVIPAPGVQVTISNPYLDQAGMIAEFLSQLKSELPQGDVYNAALQTCKDFIVNDFMPMITSLASRCIEDALSMFGSQLYIQLPEIPELGPIDIPELRSAQQTLDQAACAAMGAMSEGMAQAKFIQDLVESVVSEVGQIAIQDMLEKIVKEELVPEIRQIAEDAIDAVNVPNLDVSTLVDPPVIEFEIPSYPDPLKEFNPHAYIPRIDASLEITATVDVDLSTFQSELFGPKLLQCLDEMTEIAKNAVEECRDEIVASTTELFTALIDAVEYPPPSQSVTISIG